MLETFSFGRIAADKDDESIDVALESPQSGFDRQLGTVAALQGDQFIDGCDGFELGATQGRRDNLPRFGCDDFRKFHFEQVASRV